MRLKDPSQKLSSEGGASAEILDQVLGTADRKRARPSSSLEVKVANNGSLIRPPPSKKKNQKQQQQTYEQSGGKTTRARGGGGIPNTKFDFADLEGMTEEEIMQVLYDDPKLAAAATAAAEKMQKSEQKAKPSKPKSQNGRNSYKRPPARTVSSHPDHLKAMMEEGVPVKQWIVLIVLLGLGLYQLRKAIVGSNKLAKPKRGDKLPGRKPTRKSTKKGKATSRLRSAPASPDKRMMKDEPKLSTVQESETEKVPVLTSKKNSKKRKTRKPKGAINQTKHEDKSAPEAVSNESPDSISTDGSSSVNDHNEVQTRSMPVSHENVFVEKDPQVADTENDDDGGEWCTVGSTTRNATKSRSIDKEKQTLLGSAKSSPQESNALSNKDQPQQAEGAGEPSKSGKGTVTKGDAKPKVKEVNTIVDSENQLQDIKEDSSVNSAKQTPKALQDTKEDNNVNPTKTGQTVLQVRKEVKSGKSAKTLPKESDNAGTKTLPRAREDVSEENKTEHFLDKKKNDTTDDEAIAKKLQLEEEKLAEHESVILAETEWEEVANKKKKKGKS